MGTILFEIYGLPRLNSSILKARKKATVGTYPWDVKSNLLIILLIHEDDPMAYRPITHILTLAFAEKPPKTHGYLSNTTGPTTEPSPSIALSHNRVEQAIRGGDRGAAVTVRPTHERRRGKGYEYKVCWKKTWLLERELGNAQELLRQFEEAQRGRKRGRPTRADKFW